MAATFARGFAKPAAVRLNGGAQWALCCFQTPRNAPVVSTQNTSSCSLSGCQTAAIGAPGGAMPGGDSATGPCQRPFCAFHASFMVPVASMAKTSSWLFNG